jgi:phosphoglycolate phosphatase-like HAD superfamily hydrolase
MNAPIFKQSAVVIDLDNTLIDTAVRKHAILSEVLNKNIDVADVRLDFDLKNFLGESSTENYKTFFSILESDQGIKSHPAPLFDGAKAAVDWLRAQGHKVVIVTCRPASCKAETMKELQDHSISVGENELQMPPAQENGQPMGDQAATKFKQKVLEELAEDYDVIATVGDRPSDISAGLAKHIPGVLLPNTLSKEQVRDYAKNRQVHICKTWVAVAAAIQLVDAGKRDSRALRDTLSSQYALWLRDIDEKCRTVVTVAAALSAVSGHYLLDSDVPLYFSILALFAFLCSVLSLVYAIRGFTSRSISRGAIPVRTRLGQWFSILVGVPARWMRIEGDAIDQYEKLQKATELEQSRVHLGLLFRRYPTLDSDARLNLRLFELYAANYSKLYAERLASQLLIIAVVLMVAGVIVSGVLVPIVSLFGVKEVLISTWRARTMKFEAALLLIGTFLVLAFAFWMAAERPKREARK